MNIIIDGSSNIIQWSETGSPTPDAGQTLVELTEVQANALIAATEKPNGGLTFSNGVIGTLPVPVPGPAPDPLKPYRDALSAAAAQDAGLTQATKTALNALLAAMAPR